MQVDTTALRKICSWPLFLAGCIGLVVVLRIDDYTWQPWALTEGRPDFSPGHIIRSILICFSVSCALWSFVWGKRPRFSLASDGAIPIERWSIILALGFSLLFACCFLISPPYFSTLSLEDGPVEWGSALWVLAASLLFVLACIKSRACGLGMIFQATCLLLAAVFFLIGMEEVSWFQRVVGYNTPEMLVNNAQHEANLHNFFTSVFENGYYFGASLFLVVMPYVYQALPRLSQFRYLRLFVPRTFIALIGAIACAYNYDMWNIIFTQISFFSAVFILIVLAVYSEDRGERHLIVATLAVMFIAQAAFFFTGTRLVRLWETTEYKEFFIPMGFFLYSLDVLSRIKQTVTEGVTAPGKPGG